MKKTTTICLLIAFLYSFQFAVSLPIDERDITSHCNATLASLGSNQPHAYENYFEWTKAPDQAIKLTTEKLPNTVTTIAVAPVTAHEYNLLFGKSKDKSISRVTAAQNKEIKDVQSALKTRYGKDSGARQFTRDNLEKQLKEEGASFVIIIGHNDQGRFPLLDGKSVYLDDIVTKARPNQRIILISCDSATQASNKQLAATINRKVTYKEGFDIADRIASFIRAAGRPVSLSEVQVQLNKDVKQTQRNRKIAFFIMKAACVGGTAIIVALIVRELDPCDGKESSNCSNGKGKDH
jgi:hypothetical protein